MEQNEWNLFVASLLTVGEVRASLVERVLVPDGGDGGHHRVVVLTTEAVRSKAFHRQLLKTD